MSDTTIDDTISHPHGWSIVDRNGVVWAGILAMTTSLVISLRRADMQRICDDLNVDYRTDRRKPYRVVRLYWREEERDE